MPSLHRLRGRGKEKAQMLRARDPDSGRSPQREFVAASASLRTPSHVFFRMQASEYQYLYYTLAAVVAAWG